MAGLFNITESDIKSSLQIIDSHTSTMNSTIREVEGVSGAVATAFRSQSSSDFQGALSEWNGIYQEILNKFRTVQADLDQANNIITNVNDGNLQQTSSVRSDIGNVLAGG